MLRDMISNRASEHGVTCFERIQDRPLRDRSHNIELNFALDMCKLSQMRGQYNSNHGSVWTSTESTAGRSRTIGAQLFPESGDAYTCPPVVPK